MSKRNKNIISGKKEEEPKEQLESPGIVFPWKNILICIAMVIMIFFLHLNVFDGLASFFETHDRDEFLGAIATRGVKMGFLVVMAFILLVQANKLVTKKFWGWIVNAVLWILVFFYAGELWLCISPPSQGNTEAYIGRIWFAKHWQLNKLGFRDREYELRDLIHKKFIFYIGDSYVAGHGIKDTADRTTNLLERSLQNEYVIVNVGMNGSATRNETNLLRSFPVRPSIVVLAHVVNDIEDVIPPENSDVSLNEMTTSAFSEFIYQHSRNSLLLDMFYHFVKLVNFGKVIKGHEKNGFTQNYEWYKDTTVFNKHMQDIQIMANYVTDTMHARFLLVTYPENSLIDTTDICVNRKLEKFLTKNDSVRVYNTTPILKQVFFYNLTVNIMDGHPSKKINRMVADSLHKFILEWDKSFK